MVFDHLHVLEDQRAAVLLRVLLVVLLALSQCFVGGSHLVGPDPLFSQHRLSRRRHLVELQVVNVVKRHQLGSLVVGVVVWYMLVSLVN